MEGSSVSQAQPCLGVGVSTGLHCPLSWQIPWADFLIKKEGLGTSYWSSSSISLFRHNYERTRTNKPLGTWLQTCYHNYIKQVPLARHSPNDIMP